MNKLNSYRPQIEQIRRLLNWFIDESKRAEAIKIIKNGDIDNLPDDLEIHRGRINQAIIAMSYIPDALHGQVVAEIQKSESAYNQGIALTDEENNEVQQIVDGMNF